MAASDEISPASPTNPPPVVRKKGIFPFFPTNLLLVFVALTWGCNDSETSVPPDAPAGVSVGAPTNVRTTPGDTQVTIRWDGVPGATAYNLYWATTGGVTKSTGNQIVGVTSPYTHTGLTNGAAYFYTVTALNGGGESGPSVEVSDTPVAPAVVRFFAFGDGGTGEAGQYSVAAAVASKCATNGCDFGLILGDVIYPVGVTSATDLQFQTKFEEPYSAFNIPFYISLGNHDYALDFGQGAYNVAYASTSAIFTMPGEFYVFDQAPVKFLALGTNLITFDFENAVAVQGEFFSNALTANIQGWRIAFSHHPYISNGVHGDAVGNIKTFFDTYLCGKVDLFLAGHDHDLQVLPGPPGCPGVFVVAGGGGKSARPLSGENPTYFEISSLGFAYFRVTPERILLEMITTDRVVQFSFEIFAP